LPRDLALLRHASVFILAHEKSEGGLGDDGEVVKVGLFLADDRCPVAIGVVLEAALLGVLGVVIKCSDGDV